MGISTLVIGLLVMLIYFIWFPNGLVLAGAIDGLTLVILVDLVLGPTLTFIVFNRNKASLKFDLSLIALLQIGALLYGTKLIYHERPVAIVMGTQYVQLITNSQLEDFGLPKTFSTHNGPDYFYLDAGNDLAKIMPDEAIHEFTGQYPWIAQHNLYKPLNDVSAQDFAKRSEMLVHRQINNEAFNTFVESHNNTADKCAWLPLKSAHVIGAGYVCFNQQGVSRTKVVPFSVK